MSHQWEGKYNLLHPSNPAQQRSGALYLKTIMNFHKAIHFVGKVDDNLSFQLEMEEENGYPN